MKKEGPRKPRTTKQKTPATEPVSTALAQDFPTPVPTPASAGTESAGIVNTPSTIFAGGHAGALGPTSFSAIFTENQSDLGSGLWDVDAEFGDNFSFRYPEPSLSNTAPEDIQLGMKILSVIPSRTRCIDLVDRYFVALHPMDPILHKPTISLWLEGLWSYFMPCMEEPRNPKKLRIMAQTICKNQQHRIDSDARKDYERWVVAFTGSRMRWETIGVLLAVFGISYMTYPPWDPARNVTNSDSGLFARQMLSSVRDSIQLCESMEGINTVRVWLLYSRLSLRFMCGEESKMSRLIPSSQLS